MTTTAPTGLQGQVITPSDPDYDQARRVWNGAIDRRPAFIVRCRNSDDVSAAVRVAARHGLPLAVRGGGHSIPGLSVCEGGLVADLSPMRGITVDGQQVHVQPGVLWAELDAALEPRGRAVPGGEISHTGVAGLTLGGGVGWLSRAYGLACDNLLAAEVVLADGSLVEADDELLWGLRGGGGNFGVVTRFTFRTNSIPVPMFAGMVLHPIARAREGLAVLRDVAATAPDGLGLNAAMITAPPAPFVPPELHGQLVIALAAAHVGPHDEAAELTRRLREFATPAADLFAPMPYTALQSLFDAGAPHGVATHARSEWLRPLDDAGIDALVSAAEAMTSPMSQVLLRVMGGAISRVPADATAFRFREAASMVTLAAMWPDAASPGQAHTAWARESWAALRPWSAGGGYVNHLGDEGPARIREAYGAATWARLVALKNRYDPTNLFALNQNVPPNGSVP
jgi:hypothetical protein